MQLTRCETRAIVGGRGLRPSVLPWDLVLCRNAPPELVTHLVRLHWIATVLVRFGAILIAGLFRFIDKREQFLRGPVVPLGAKSAVWREAQAAVCRDWKHVKRSV